MGKVTLSFLLLLVSGPLAFAQDDYHKWEFFGGYSHNRIDTGISDSDPDFDDIIDEREGFHGFNLAVTGNLKRHVGVKFDFSGHFKQKFFAVGPTGVDVDSSLFNMLGGVQIKDNSTEATFKPFAHALAGFARAKNDVRVLDPPAFCAFVFPSPCPASFEETDTGFAAALGGGLDIRAGRRVDIRAVQVDYNPTWLFDSTQHNFRIGFGVVIH